MAAVESVLNTARKELGTTESPANSNRTKYGKWFGLDGYAWCMMFVMWVFATAGMKLPYRTASCGDLLNWYRKNRPQSVVNVPQPGDIVIYNFGHTGIVETAGNGTITAIEGNTSHGTSGSQSNGGMVCRRTRKISTVTAYIRPDYDKKENKFMDNTPNPAHREGVEWARKKDILRGDTSGNLGLSQNVTKQQLCTILFRFAKYIDRA